MKDIVIIGAGGFGRETIDTIKAINADTLTWRILGVVDDAPSPINIARLEALGLRHLGGLEALPAHSSVAICVGDPATRERVADALADRDIAFPTLIHPSSTIGSSFVHGDGLIALAGVSIGANVTVGDHVHLNAHAVIGHDVLVEDVVSVNPNATVSGECHVRRAALLGASSTVLQQLTIGQRVTVGAGACVVRDVPDEQVVVGIPAQPLKKGQSA